MKMFYIALFVIYPLFMTDGYQNTTRTKCILYALIIGVAFFICIWKDYEKNVEEYGGLPKTKLKNFKNALTVTDRFGLAFILSSFVSYVFAKYRPVAFSGGTDSYLGFFTVIICALGFWVASRQATVDEVFTLIASLGGAFVSLFAVIQFMGADLFGLFSRIASNTDRLYNFLSTLGNTSVFGQYMVLILPIAVIGYCKAEHLIMKISFSLCCNLMIWGIMVANTDAAYLGLIVICMLGSVILLRRKSTFIRSLELLVQMNVSVMLLKCIYSLCAGARGRSAITRMIMNINFSIYIIFIMVLILIISFFNRKIKNDMIYKRISAVASVLCVVLVAVTICLFIYFSVIDRQSDFFGLERYLRFDNHWGTDRGYVWNWIWTIYSTCSPIRKIIGFGQGSVVFELFTHYKHEMMYELKYYFDNAHNVYLHLLFTTGLLGAVTYVGMICAALYSGVKKALHGNEYVWGVVISVCAYAVVDFFSVLQPITLGLYIVILAILSAKCNK